MEYHMFKFLAVLVASVSGGLGDGHEKWICQSGPQYIRAFSIWRSCDPITHYSQRDNLPRQSIEHDLSVIAYSVGTRVDLDDSATRVTLSVSRHTAIGVETFGAGFFPEDIQLQIEWQTSENTWNKYDCTAQVNGSCLVGGEYISEYISIAIQRNINTEHNNIERIDMISRERWEELLDANLVRIRLADKEFLEIEKAMLNKIDVWWEHLEEGCDGTH
jgi:hypothetical protein